jgi:cellulose synthase/poly-beta-1,6-N-acetylglucosamine synthase-like glycosyltransferase
MSGLISASLSDPVIGLAINASIPSIDIHNAIKSALINQSDFVDELLILNRSFEQRLYAAFAAQNSLGFLAEIDASNIVIDTSNQTTRLHHLPFATYRSGVAETQFLAAPPPKQLRYLLAQDLDADRLPQLRIVTPTALNAAVEMHLRDQRVHEAVFGYATRYPEHSSRVTLLGFQGWIMGFVLGICPAFIVLFPSVSLTALHVFAWIFFFGCVVLRLLAAMTENRTTGPVLSPFKNADLPHYAVLVALYKEANIAAQITDCLKNLNWPSTKLYIYLICEDDDQETQTALAALELPPNFHTVSVPDYGPRTKPKALMYALPLVEAEYLVLYDAEDRPHPDQLIEAYQKFQNSDQKVACVQAPLEITNRQHSMLTALFAFEYSALFRGLLPFLSRYNLFIPLGGTSNHFRVKTLRDIGGWDPFNVTEDADLGLRLHRYGYQTKTISLATKEDAPEELLIWLKQRTRWFKGHMQTWMVSLRNPRMLISEIGLRSFLISQIMLGGIVVSALVHPLLIASVVIMGALFFHSETTLTLASPLAMLDFFNVILGYFAFMVLGYSSARNDERAGIWKRMIAIPPYWMLLSVAAWRALFQIVRAPHKWEKTPHKPTLGNH